MDMHDWGELLMIGLVVGGVALMLWVSTGAYGYFGDSSTAYSEYGDNTKWDEELWDEDEEL